MILPQPWLAIDIETVAGRPEDVERYLRMHFTPAGNMKTPEAIGRRWLEWREEKREKAGLLDQARVIVVSLTSLEETRALHCLREEPLHAHPDGLGWIEGFASRRKMLLALRVGLDALVGPETLLVGHNVKSFDLVKLRWSYLHEQLRLPQALVAEQPLFDTMREYGRRYSMVERPFVALADLLEEFRLENHKGELDGSRIQEFYDAGRFDEIVTYALKDAAVEAQLYLRMTGQVEDAPEPGAEGLA